MPAVPAVSTAQRRARLIDRHLLGVPGRSARPIDDVTKALVMLHSTDPSTPYLSIHARTSASVVAIDAALYDEPRTLLRHTTLRRTVFVVPGDVVPLAHGAYNPPLVNRLRKQLVTWIDASPDVRGSAANFLAQTESAIIERLAAGGPTTGLQLAKDVTGLRVTIEPAPGAALSKPIRLTSKVLELLAAEGRIARGRPSGAHFASAAWTWAAASSWWPSGVGDLDSSTALAGLLDRYLAAFGPATVTDMAWWTGLGKRPIAAALADIDAVEVALEGVETGWMRPRDLHDLSDLRDESDLRDDPAAAIALLPGLDATTMGWKQRSWYVDDAKAVGLFDQNGNAGPTIWVDGRVVGAWTQRSDGEVVTEVLDDVGSSGAAAIGAEAMRLAEWLGEVRVKWRFPTPRTKELASGR